MYRYYTGEIQDAIEFALPQITDTLTSFPASYFTGGYAEEQLRQEPLSVFIAITDSIRAAVDRLSKPEQLDEHFSDWECPV